MLECWVGRAIRLKVWLKNVCKKLAKNIINNHTINYKSYLQWSRDCAKAYRRGSTSSHPLPITHNNPNPVSCKMLNSTLTEPEKPLVFLKTCSTSWKAPITHSNSTFHTEPVPIYLKQILVLSKLLKLSEYNTRPTDYLLKVVPDTQFMYQFKKLKLWPVWWLSKTLL